MEEAVEMTREAGLEKLREALDLTERMLAEARRDNWERVQWLENRRHFILRRCFDVAGVLPSPEAVHELLHRIMEVDRKVASRVTQARDETAAVLQALNQGRNATRAYREVEG